MNLSIPFFPEPVRCGRFKIDSSGLTHESFNGRYVSPADLENGDCCDFLKSQPGIRDTERCTLVQAFTLAVYLHRLGIKINSAARTPDALVLATWNARSIEK